MPCSLVGWLAGEMTLLSVSDRLMTSRLYPLSLWKNTLCVDGVMFSLLEKVLEYE